MSCTHWRAPLRQIHADVAASRPVSEIALLGLAPDRQTPPLKSICLSRRGWITSGCIASPSSCGALTALLADVIRHSGCQRCTYSSKHRAPSLHLAHPPLWHNEISTSEEIHAKVLDSDKILGADARWRMRRRGWWSFAPPTCRASRRSSQTTGLTSLPPSQTPTVRCLLPPHEVLGRQSSLDLRTSLHVTQPWRTVVALVATPPLIAHECELVPSLGATCGRGGPPLQQ